MFNFAKKIIIENRENDDLLYEFVLTEIENEIIIKSLWAKSIAMAEGNKNKVEPLYMQYRVQNIKDQFTKLNIAYQDIKKEILFQKIKAIFTESQIEEINTPIKKPKPIKKLEQREEETPFEILADGTKLNKYGEVI